MYSNKENVNILTALLVRYGVEHIVVCPGSRNAPLVHNFNESPDITCHPVTDERSAGFIALGLRKQLHAPVAVCVTSGSALLNLAPAVAEATYQQLGIIVISADRPQAWIGQLDGQTMPQPGALSSFVGKCVQLPEPKDDTEHWHCNRLICEAIIANLSGSHPSVHINVPITEPLFEFTKQVLPAERRISWGEWEDDIVRDKVITQIVKAKRPMMVIGQNAGGELPDDYYNSLRNKMVVLTEQLAIADQTFTDQMLYAIEKRPKVYVPDFVIYLGGNTISKRLRQWMRNLNATIVVVTTDGSVADNSQHTIAIIKGKAYKVFSDINGFLWDKHKKTVFIKKWDALLGSVKERHEAFVPDYSAMLAVKLFEEKMTRDDTVHYANSMSVRLGAIYARHFIHCNRGINGIEGSLSVAAGAALGAMNQDGSNVYCVIGDLSFFYDQNALWQQQLSGNFRIMLLNNGQGAIFRNLKGLEKSSARDNLVAASHTTSAEGICRQYNIRYACATDEASLKDGLAMLMSDSDRPVLLEVMTDAKEDERVFKNYYANFRNL